MNHELDPQNSWFSRGERHPVVLSTRARLVRNVENYPFPNRLDKEKQDELLGRIEQALVHGEPENRLDLEKTVPLTQRLAAERLLISAPSFQKKKGLLWLFEGESRGAFWGAQDHLSLFSLDSGLAVKTVADRVLKWESFLASLLDFAALPGWGYLSSNPAFTGSGLKLSLLLHIPALVRTGMLEQVFRAVEAQGYSLSAFWALEQGESEFYLLSGQFSCGLAGQEQIEVLTALADRLVRFEEEARRREMSSDRRACLDRAGRAWGILSQARILSWEEALRHFSAMRSSLEFGIIPEVTLSLSQIDRLLFCLQDAHLAAGWSNRPEGEDELRADIVRHTLFGREDPCLKD